MISWRDALSLSRKRWKRKRIFGSLKYSAPLFLLTLLTIVTLNICCTIMQRIRDAAIDPDYPHPTHLRVSVPAKSTSGITIAQLKALKAHPAVRQVMGRMTWVINVYADAGEVRYAPLSELCGYRKEFFDLYRTLPPEKSDPACVPVLLGRDLLALSWSPEQRKFVRNQGEEMRRWLGRRFTVYLNPLGMEVYDPKFVTEQLDYPRYRKSMLEKRLRHLGDLERSNPDLARRQDALFVNMQVVGFIRDPSDSGRTTVVPQEIAEQIVELSAYQRGKKPVPATEDNLAAVNLLVAQGHEREVSDLARSLGLGVYDRNGAGIVSTLYKEVREDPGARLTFFVVVSLYSLAMMVVIYQLLSGQVKDSIREIGLLRCIGAHRRDIMRVFIAMNLVRLARIYAACLVAGYALLLAGGCWTAGKLNLIDPDNLAKGTIPEFLISRIDHFSPFWLMGPPWMALLPLLFLMPVALGAAALPIWHAMGVQPSEALKD